MLKTHVGVRSQTPANGRVTNRGAVVAGIAAIGGVLAASTCCLPVLPFVIATGVAGSSAFLSAARPYLLGLSILFIGLGFYQARGAKGCRRRPSRTGLIFLWVSTAFVLISIFFPQMMANAAADLLTR
jgi:hypothetical protein